LHRVFVESLALKTGEDFALGKKDLHYLVHVLRAREGTRFVVVDMAGDSFLAEIIKKEGAWKGRVLERLDVRITRPNVEVVLVPALLKGDKNELVVQKAVEIGATAIVFFVGERSVPRLDQPRIDSRKQRLQTIAKEAARQCGLCFVPEVQIRKSLGEAIADIMCEKGYFLDEVQPQVMLFSHLSRNKPRSVCIVVGPEGSFSDAERALVLSKGFLPSSVGPRILRAETASIVAVTLCMAAVGDMGKVSDEHC